MSPRSPAALALAQMIQDQRDAARALVTVLAEEKAALLHHQSPEVLEKVIADKTAAADRLRQLTDPLRKLGGNSAAEVEALLQALPQAARALLDWRELCALARQCQDANLENAALLEVRHRQVRDALRSLRGEQDPQTYGRGGASHLRLASQRLGAA